AETQRFVDLARDVERRPVDQSAAERVGEVRRLVVRLARREEVAGPSEHDPNRGVALEVAELDLELVGRPEVVGVEERDERAAAGADARVARGARAAVR